MSTTSPQPLQYPEHRSAITGVVRLLMTRAGITSRAALAMAVKPTISQSTLYSRMNNETEWNAADFLCLAEVFGVPAAVFLAEPTLNGIAPYLGLTAGELGEELAVASQNRKKMMVSDLQVLTGGAKATPKPLPFLHLV